MKQTFQIVTTAGITYTQGGAYDAFADLGHGKAVLKAYTHQVDYVVLQFSGGLTLEIHESRIEHIARTKSD